MATDNFTTCFLWTVGAEGGFTADPADSGNWTSGVVGAGELRGTKFGISAAAYPALDIANLTLGQAEAIYQADYWPKIRGDELPLPVARATFDAAVNSGAGRAIQWLQSAAGVAPDGQLGPVTMAAIQAADPVPLAVDALAARLQFLGSLAVWERYGLGWARRVLNLHAAILG
ncbi:glycoside hydrolase family 108 protein [Acidocella sp.]|uniref:glycoside hydrolase family 108 protein n=1 Tax=Acidocella sp. TaxID=50710 RepID=UPI002624D272|nr:glycosyl hydrolase 108 family protein [Acidocella sp.]